MKKILYVAHHFPPLGGAGVQRTVKFVKYLPATGILPIIVTGHGVSESKWEVEDDTMLCEIPKEVPIFRATGGEERQENLEVSGGVDSRVRGLVDAGLRASKEHRVDAVIVSMSPFENCEVGRVLSEQLGVPWIADLRDPWALDEFQVYRMFTQRWLELRKMRKLLGTAAGIIMNTPVAREKLLATFPEFRGRHVTSITNGFDAEDFANPPVLSRRESFRIVHTGSFHTSMGVRQKSKQALYRLLGRCETGMEILPRSPYYLLRALEMVSRKDPEVFDRIETVFAGVVTDADRRLISQSGVSEKVTVTGYLEHGESVKQAASADLLFLPLHGLKPGRLASIVPGKTYEYLATGNPILGALPAGDARDFVKAAGNCCVVDPEDADGIAKGIRHFFKLWQDGAIEYRRNPASIRQFDRQALTVELADFLNSVVTQEQV